MSIMSTFESMDYGPAPESAAEANAWLDRHNRTFGHFVDGAFTDIAGETFASRNPANGEELAQVSQGTDADIDAAVAAARAAQPAWAALGGHGRAKHLYAIARLVQKHSRLFAVLETMDNGKPIRESRDIDIPLVARHFYHHAGWAQLQESELAEQVPAGVVGQVIPWNFPLLMLAWKIAPAIAMGNTVVLKPAEYTSLTALLFAEVCQQAGLPAGVVNIVTGDGRTGRAVVEHSGIDKVAFTGSTEVGRLIREATAGSGKKLTLELGGKSPYIVFDDADLDAAVEGLVDAIWFNQGQVCCAGSRLLVHEGVAETLYAKIRARMKNLRIGDPLDKAIDMGAIVDPTQLERITALVQQGVDEGATIHQADASCPDGGCFFPPTLLTDVEPANTVVQEEIFGPVLVGMTFRTPAEAVQLANNTRYGLAASVWTENINLAMDIAPKVKAGVVWVNCTNQFDAAAGFGGMRESGFGREGGKEGLYEYLKPAYTKDLPAHPEPVALDADALPGGTVTGIDRTAKLYVGGKQARPDSGYSRPVTGPDGALIAHVGAGNRKDIRNAVEAAHKAAGWARATAHNRAQVIYYIAENLAARSDEFAARLRAMTGASAKAANAEVEASVQRLFHWAAWADKYDGAVHGVPLRGVAIAMHEPNGVMGIVCPDDAPLLGFVSTVFPAVAMGNRVVALPSTPHPLAALDLYQVLDTSDLPGGVLNIVPGDKDELAAVLARHDDLDAVWYWGGKDGSRQVEALSTGNLKRTWVSDGTTRDWTNPVQGAGQEFLRHATQVKNVWAPYGE